MTKRTNSDPIFTPELFKVIKIFGLISVGIVLVLSFFNTKRANNTGADPVFRMADSNRLYFLNIRAIDYDREARSDAKMTLYRHEKGTVSDGIPTLDFVIILNIRKDEAYLYFEPQNVDWPIRLKARDGENEKIFEFQNGNKSTFYSYLEELKPWFLGESSFEMETNNGWREIWHNPSEKQAIKTTLEDYYRLINKDY